MFFSSSWIEIGGLSRPRLAATSVNNDEDNLWIIGGTYDMLDGESHEALWQGWPHFFCSGQKNRLKKLGGHKNVSKKLDGQSITL